MGFSKDFMWGAATAAYQVEGAYNADGKGLSVWDVTSSVNGRVVHGENGNEACDHYHRFKAGHVSYLTEPVTLTRRVSSSTATLLMNLLQRE